MHGLVFTQLKKYVTTKYDFSTWLTLLENADLKGEIYVMSKIYPDDDLVKIVAAASEATKLPAVDIVEDFGMFLVPDLLKIYGAALDPSWKTLDTLEHVENTIHKVVRMRDAAATPPKLICKRVSPTIVEIIYTSERRLCALAIGLTKGVAKHYDENIKIIEPTCMLKGDSECKLIITQH